MATWLKARWRPIMMAVLVVTVGLAFVTWRANTATAAESAPRFTATEISDAVLFNDGPAAKHLTELRRGPTAWTDDLRTLQRRINDSILADRRWADTFVSQMQSGNPRLVERGMSSLGVLARAALDGLYGADKIDEALVEIDKKWMEELMAKAAMLNNEFSFDNGADVWFETDLVVVVAVAAALVLVLALIDFTPKDWSDRADLAHEVMVGEVTAGLEAGY